MNKLTGTLTLLFLLGTVISIVVGGFITTLFTIKLFTEITTEIIFIITIVWMVFVIVVEEIISYKIRHSHTTNLI